MPVKFAIYTYNQHSRGAGALRAEMTRGPNRVDTVRTTGGGLRFSRIAQTFDVQRDPHALICWGNVGLNSIDKPNNLMLNFRNKQMFTNKRDFFLMSRDIAPELVARFFVPSYLSRSAAMEALEANRSQDPSKVILVERHELTSHSGDGIRLIRSGDSLSANARLWTRYIPKKSEFRAHFCKPSGSIYFQQKKLREGSAVTGDTYAVRNHTAGWVYCTQDITVPDAVRQAVQVFVRNDFNTLDFGAIDIIYNEQHNQAYILEVNTAPGIEGSTAEWYAAQVKHLLNTHNFAGNSCIYNRRAA